MSPTRLHMERIVIDAGGILSDNTGMLIQAARPALFSATSRPELIVSVMYANLMSERLWSLARHISKSKESFRKKDLSDRMLSIQKFVNGRFYHAKHLEFGRIWGLHERETITDRADLEASDYAMGILTRCFRRKLGEVAWAPTVLEFLKAGLFPEYVYPTVDVILALGPVFGDLPNKPLGMTSCADECILIASLALALKCCRPEDVVFLGSPFHYSLFLFPEGSDGFWFNAKREFFDARSWASLHGGGSAGDVKQAYEDRMWVVDRVITPRGYCIFPKGEATLPAEEVQRLVERMNRFLGMELAFACGAANLVEDRTHRVLPSLDGCESGEEFAGRVQDLVETKGDSLAAASRYTARRLDVPDPGIYVAAAQTGYKMLLRSAEILTVEDAVSMVRGIPGRESIFGASGRIALPDEVFLFNTASDNERALALHVLLLLSSSFTAGQKASLALDRDAVPWSARFLDSKWGGSDL